MHYFANSEYRMRQCNTHIMGYVHLRQRATEQYAPRKIQRSCQNRRNPHKF